MGLQPGRNRAAAWMGSGCRGGEPQPVAHRLPLRRIHEHVPLRAPLGEATVHGRLLLRRVARADDGHVHALGEVLRRVDRPQRRLARALPLAVRVGVGVAELVGEVDGDGLVLGQLVPLHLLHRVRG